MGLTIRRIVCDLDSWLNSINLDLHKKILPNIKELWRAGDLREKMVAANAAIGSIRKRWEVRGPPARKRTILTVSTLDATAVLYVCIDQGNL